MQTNSRPLFNKGRVVKKESLEQLRDFPSELAETAFRPYSDGILFGCEVSYRDETVGVSDGAVKHQGKILLLHKEEFPFDRFGRPVSVKLKMGDERVTEDFVTMDMEIGIDEGQEAGQNEMELGRFRLSKGAKLRTRYTGVRDFRTANNTLDLTHVAYAGMEQPTLAPELLRQYAGFLLNSGTTDSYDLSFAFLCLNSTVVHRDCILQYLSRRLGEPYAERSNEAILERMVRIVEQRGNGSDSGGGLFRKGPSIV